MAGAESVSSSEAKEKWEKHSTGHGSAFSPFCLSIYGCSGSSVLHIVVTCGLPIWWLLLLQSTASVVGAHGLVESSPTRDGTCVPCIGRQIFFFFLIIIF